MDYKRHYDLLMEKVKNRALLKDIYTERHHILPKCLGGGNTKDNIVKLLPKEHFIAHLLLFKIYPNNKEIAYAFWMMCNGNRKEKRGYLVSGKIYEEIRNKFIEIMKSRGGFFKGKNHTEDSKQKNRDSHIGKSTWNGKKHTKESKEKMSESAKGRKLSSATRKKMSEYHINRPKSVETRKKMSESSKGDNNNYKRYLLRTGKSHVNSKPVLQFDLEDNLIKEWVSGRVASLELNIGYNSINNCLRGKTKTSHGFIWKYK